MFVFLLAIGTSKVTGQSAQVEFFVSNQDSSVLSTLQLICTSPTDTVIYPFNGRQRITASIVEGAVCRLHYANEVFVRPKFVYHFDQIDSSGFLGPMSVNLKTGERRILGAKIQLHWQNRVVACVRQDSLDDHLSPLIQVVPIKQLNIALRVDVSNDLPERNYPVIRSCCRGTVTYIDGIPVRSPANPVVSSYSEALFYPPSFGVSAEFESEMDAKNNR